MKRGYINRAFFLPAGTQVHRVRQEPGAVRLQERALAHVHLFHDTCAWPSPVSRPVPGLVFSLYIGHSRHPASRGTCTSLYIGHSRHPASRGTCTSLYIVVGAESA